jgi:hypothetical protein
MELTLLSRGGQPVQLDRERVIFFDMQASDVLYKKYGENHYAGLVVPAPQGAPPDAVAMKDVAGLAFYLWLGLLADAREHGEDLTLEQVKQWINPANRRRLFFAVLVALARDSDSPPMPGKAAAVPESPAGAASVPPGPSHPGPRSTLSTRSASRSPSSGKRRSSSGRSR